MRARFRRRAVRDSAFAACGAPDHRVWSVSAAGHVLLWDGASWQVKAVLPSGLRAVWGTSATELWIGGEGGLVMRGTVTGSDVTFQRATLDTTQTIARIVATSPSDVGPSRTGSCTGGTLDRVFRLDPSSGGAPPTFSAITVPSTLGPEGTLSLSALWTSGSDAWVAGSENGCAGPDPCTFTSGLVARKWTGARLWSPRGTRSRSCSDWFNPIAAAHDRDARRHAARRLRGDGEDCARGANRRGRRQARCRRRRRHRTTKAPTARRRTSSTVTDFLPISGRRATTTCGSSGQSGLVRHFDGTSWRRIRTSLTNMTPLLAGSRGVHAVVDPSGEQDIWVVGDDDGPSPGRSSPMKTISPSSQPASRSPGGPLLACGDDAGPRSNSNRLALATDAAPLEGGPADHASDGAERHALAPRLGRRSTPPLPRSRAVEPCMKSIVAGPRNYCATAIGRRSALLGRPRPLSATSSTIRTECRGDAHSARRARGDRRRCDGS